jgi:Gas vesicle synthesis protein GvpL/GvpF
MPRAASARRGARSRPTAAPANASKTAKSVKAIAKHSSSRSANRSAKPAVKRNAPAHAAAKPQARGGGRTALPGDRRASEKVVQGGRATSPGSDTSAGASRGKYVYCIIESGEPLRFGPIGIGADPSDVYTVHYRNLAAVVSDAPLEVFDSTRENVLAHERVNETVMREHTVIPMSFGTIFKTREDIVELLRSAAEAFGDVLTKMQNKLEFGLKVLWDRDQAVREVENDDEDISRLKKEISGQKGPTYFARMQYGRLIDSALQSRSERYVADILEQLREVSVASRINKPIGDKMIMNAAFLISRDRETAFDGKVKSIASRFDKLTFKYTGPWPPYNFVNIRLKLERA